MAHRYLHHQSTARKANPDRDEFAEVSEGGDSDVAGVFMVPDYLYEMPPCNLQG